MKNFFDTGLYDSQATAVKPVSAEQFDFDAYDAHEKSLHQRCIAFQKSISGVLVYRRVRVAEVFSYDAKDKKRSLEWQLGGLQQSLSYATDIPNFLEPWYGIGTIASAFGIDYHWANKQAPAVLAPFKDLTDALNHCPEPVENTPIGKQTLEMIEYFIDKTKGRLPISLTDTQSPLNIASYLVQSSTFLTDMILYPSIFKQLLDVVSDLAIAFTRNQLQLLESVIVWPGHGFPSSRAFKGIGMSDDTMLMISGQHYHDLCIPAVEKFGRAFNGPAFHSCGNWSSRISHILQINNLRMADGAFSAETDPAYNPAEPFGDFSHSAVILNARIVGNSDTVVNTVRRLWKPGMKLIVTTYCTTPEEQSAAYEQIHEICRD